MSQFIANGVIAQAAPLVPWITNVAETLRFIVANSIIIAGSIFASACIIMVLHVFVKGLKGLDFGDMFRGDVKQEVSLTKFWTNIAYFTATVAFIGKIFMSPGTTEADNILWLIYLGGVGSNAIAAKWLGLKYAGAMTNPPQLDQLPK